MYHENPNIFKLRSWILQNQASLRKNYSFPVIENILRKHRTSSAKQYQVPWKLICVALKERNIFHLNVNVPTVLSFLGNKDSQEI